MELTDAEVEQLKQEREAAKQEAERARQEMTAARDAYTRDIQQVSQYVASVLSQPQQQAPQQVDEDDLFVQHPNLEKKIQQRVNDQLRPIAQHYLADSLDKELRLARKDDAMPLYGKYKDEIESLVRQAVQVNPAHANAQTVKTAYQLVLNKHFEDVVEEEVKKRTTKPVVEDVEDQEEETAADSTRTPTSSSGRPSAPVSLGPAAARPAAVPPKKRVRLTTGEANMAAVLNIDPQEYAQYRDPNIEVDVMGFKGRRRI